MMSFLSTEWQNKNSLASTYTRDGHVAMAAEARAMYATSLGYFTVSTPPSAMKVFRDKLVSLYNPDINAWKETLSYYDDNWTWFGIALYSNLLPNLAEHVPSSAYSK